MTRVMEVRKINALESPFDPDDEDIPASWTPEHVGRRLISAFVTLRGMPGLKRPREPGGNWPQYSYTFEDRAGWEQYRADRDADKNRVTIKPTSRDIWAMEQGLGWLGELRNVDAGIALTVQEWAAARAIERPIRNLCIERKWGVTGFYKRLQAGLETISGRLNKAVIRVF